MMLANCEFVTGALANPTTSVPKKEVIFTVAYFGKGIAPYHMRLLDCVNKNRDAYSTHVVLAFMSNSDVFTKSEQVHLVSSLAGVNQVVPVEHKSGDHCVELAIQYAVAFLGDNRYKLVYQPKNTFVDKTKLDGLNIEFVEID